MTHHTTTASGPGVDASTPLTPPTRHRRGSDTGPLPATLHVHYDPMPDHTHPVDVPAIVGWLGVLGPTATWFLFLTSQWAFYDQATSYPTGALAAQLGVGTSALTGAVNRVVMFGVGYWASPDVLVIGSPLPPVPARLADRLADLTQHEAA